MDGFPVSVSIYLSGQEYFSTEISSWVLAGLLFDGFELVNFVPQLPQNLVPVIIFLPQI